MTIESAVHIGDVEIVPIVESTLGCAPQVYLPNVPDVSPLAAAVAPGTCLTFAANGNIATPVRCYLVRADGKVGLVDAGNGLASIFEGLPDWSLDSNPFLELLAAAGATPEEIDWVAITHMHPDHIGWLATPDGSDWNPTFPKARHLFVDKEWKHLRDEGFAPILGRVQAVWDAGLADEVAADFRVSASVGLEPSHGHTPGHVCIVVESGERKAIMTGDILHHQLQLVAPDEIDGTDRLAPQEGLATRKALYERCVDSETVLLAGHFEEPAVGNLVRHGPGYAIRPLA